MLAFDKQRIDDLFYSDMSKDLEERVLASYFLIENLNENNQYNLII